MDERIKWRKEEKMNKKEQRKLSVMEAMWPDIHEQIEACLSDANEYGKLKCLSCTYVKFIYYQKRKEIGLYEN